MQAASKERPLRTWGSRNVGTSDPIKQRRRRILMKTKHMAVVIAVATILAWSSTTVATAANRFWRSSVGSGNWNNAANWSSVSAADTNPANNGLPLLGDGVAIQPTDGASRTIAYDVTAPNLFIVFVDLTGAGTNR